MLCDQELISAFKNGDEFALKEMYEKYMPFLCNFIKRFYLPYLDNDDKLQECFIVLYQAMTTYQTIKNVSFFAYYKLLLERHFYKLIRYHMANKRQCEQTNHLLNDYEVETFQGAGYAQTLSPEDIIIVKESFQESCQTLSASEKRAIFGCYTDPLNHPRALYRGRCKLKKMLKYTLR